MTVKMRRLLGTASLLSLLASPSIVLAQAGRAWVDPPQEAGAQPQAAAPAAQPPAASPVPSEPPKSPPPGQAEASPDKAAAPQSSQASKSPDDPQPQISSTPTRKKVTTKSRPSRKSVVERKARPSSREAASVRRSSGIQATQAENRRGPRFRSVQEGIDSGLQVMRLRTIEFPDGRRITILTRPEPGAMSELADPY
jgi:hypothetical protein